MTYSLKEARIESGKTIEEIASHLKIRKIYLIALEEGDFSLIPGEVYVKGYLKLYSNYLGLSPIPTSPAQKEVIKKALDNQPKEIIFNNKWKKYIPIIAILALILIFTAFYSMPL